FHLVTRLPALQRRPAACARPLASLHCHPHLRREERSRALHSTRAETPLVFHRARMPDCCPRRESPRAAILRAPALCKGSRFAFFQQLHSEGSTETRCPV